jgi:hypothetical protein
MGEGRLLKEFVHWVDGWTDGCRRWLLLSAMDDKGSKSSRRNRWKGDKRPARGEKKKKKNDVR